MPVLKNRRPVQTSVNLQMEAVECGAAALGSILGYYGRFVALSRLREECGINRDGSRASNILRAARNFGLEARGFRRDAESVFKTSPLPAIVYWKGAHFVVLEGSRRGMAFINDPALGRYRVTGDEFIQKFSGVVLEFVPGPDFKRGGSPYSFVRSLGKRLPGVGTPAVLIMLLSMLLVLSSVAIPVFSKVFVDKVLVEGFYSWTLPLVLGMGITLFFTALFTWLQQLYILRLQTKMTITSSSGFIWRLLRLPTSFFSQRYAPEITTRCRLNEMLSTLLSGQFSTAFLNLGTALFFLAVMYYYDPLLTLFGVLTILINIAVVRGLAPYRHDEFMRMAQESGKAEAISMGSIQCIDTIKSQGMEQDAFAFWAGCHATAVDSTQRLNVLTTIGSMAPVLMAGLYNTIILAAGALRITQGAMTIGDLVAFQILANMLVIPINRLSILGGTIQDASACMKRLDDVLNHPIETDAGDLDVTKENVLIRNENLTGALELRNITFGYSRLDQPLLENFSLSIEPGARVALVGPSGSGKSTIARIAAGLYRPWSGEVLLDSKSRDLIPDFVLKNCISMVDKSIFLFEGSFRENLTMWDDFLPDDDIIRACRDAGIYDTIITRPGGIDGYMNENGMNLSGGQRQCLEIARSLVRCPALLILDEATNALDPIKEHEIDLNIRQRGCSCLIIAHRLSTIRDADEIIVLDQGSVVQRGDHGQLIREPGLYRELIAMEGE